MTIKEPKARYKATSKANTRGTSKKNMVSSKNSSSSQKSHSRKKTISQNPLATGGRAWSSMVQAHVFVEDLSNQTVGHIEGDAQVCHDKNPQNALSVKKNTQNLEKESPDSLACFAYGSIDYFSFEGWKSVKIINKNNEMGIFDQQDNFYPLRSFKVKKSSKSVSSFTKWGLPGLLIGGLPGLLLTGFICIRPTFITGFLHNEKGEMIYVRFDQKGLKVIDALKIGVIKLV